MRATRFQINTTKKNLFFNYNCPSNEDFYGASSTLDESDIDKGNESSDEYVPECENSSEDSFVDSDDFEHENESIVSEVSKCYSFPKYILSN